jgi:signal transduction histidine kinase
MKSWLTHHRQRLSYVLMAVALVVAIALLVAGAFRLHHAVLLERQALRTQTFATAAFQIDDVGLSGSRVEALNDANAALQNVAAHDAAEGARLRVAYSVYIRDPSRPHLSRLEGVMGAETARLAREIRVSNPQARVVLISAVVAAAFLVALLIWQFDYERRTGRLDRDFAERAAELIRLRDEFVAVVSHELRTPLTSIIGYTELMADKHAGTLTEAQANYLAVIERSAARLVDLVGDLLLVAAADEGVLALERRAFDLEVLANQAVDAARPAADGAQVTLTSEHSGSEPILGDPARLAQLLDNLISNAIKFTPENGQVTVRTSSLGGYATFEVADNGDGIAASDQEHLFEPFFRARRGAMRMVPGTGLGLTITKAIADAHGGTIEVDSTLGVGTTFRVRFPAAVPGGTPDTATVSGYAG